MHKKLRKTLKQVELGELVFDFPRIMDESDCPQEKSEGYTSGRAAVGWMGPVPIRGLIGHYSMWGPDLAHRIEVGIKHSLKLGFLHQAKAQCHRSENNNWWVPA